VAVGLVKVGTNTLETMNFRQSNLFFLERSILARNIAPKERF